MFLERKNKEKTISIRYGMVLNKFWIRIPISGDLLDPDPGDKTKQKNRFLK